MQSITVASLLGVGLAPLAAGVTAVALWIAVPEQQARPDLDQVTQLNAPKWKITR